MMKTSNRLYVILLGLFLSLSGVYAQTYVTLNDIRYVLSSYLTVSVTDKYPCYSGDITIPSTVTYNGINYSVTSIGDSAFYGCQGLTSITIPNSVTSIGDYAFAGCYGLTSITIPNSVTSIGNSAFVSCAGLTSITIPNSVTSIGGRAFGWCDGLASIIVELGNSVYDSRNNCNAIIETSTNKLIAGCKNTVIPNSVTSIGDYAFAGCYGLTSITIPNSVTSIGNSAFVSCAGLTSITIPNSVTSIGDYAFEGCDGLTSITIPNSVTSIGDYAFADCDSLTSIIIPNSVTSIGNNVFHDDGQLSFILVDNSTPPIVSQKYSYSTSFYNSVNLCVPAGSINTYRNASFWGDFQNINPLPSVTVHADHGDASISYHSLTDVEVLITPHYGYHFTQWSDGNTENPRNVVITNDTVISAIFAKNQYSLTINSEDTELGTVNGPASGDYLDTLTIYAYANFGYQFEQWSDGNTDNPRNVVMTQNMAFTAQFGVLKCNLVVNASNDAFGSVKGSGSFEYQTNTTISATANYGYHFTQWSDGIADNPRNIQLTKDTTFTAVFAKNQYNLIVYSSNPSLGSVEGSTSADYLDTLVISATANYGYQFHQWSDGNTDNPRTLALTQDTYLIAQFTKIIYQAKVEVNIPNACQNPQPFSGAYLDTIQVMVHPNYGYHFTQWSDGISDNPRNVVLTKDTLFTAEFAKNQYSLIVNASNDSWGSVQGSTTQDYLSILPISATAYYGYHFTQWSDGNMDNPRNVLLTKDTTFTAVFAKNQYSITVNSANAERGATQGSATQEYLDVIVISASANYGYHFTQWSDGNTDNPRSVELTQDTSFMAEFDKNIYQVTIQSSSENVCLVSETKQVAYLDTVSFSVTLPDVTYRFSSWDDGNVDYNRSEVVTKDITYNAIVSNLYFLSATTEHGRVEGAGVYPYGSYVTLIAYPEDGYTFVKWSDGSKYNPYTLVLDKDITLEAIIEPIGSDVKDTDTESSAATKILKDGIIYILKDGKIYDLFGTIIE